MFFIHTKPFFMLKMLNCRKPNSPFQKPQREWLHAFGATISGIVWVDKHYLWMSNGCFEHHQPIITNACPTKRCQKWLHPKLVSIFPGKKKRERCHIVTSGFGRENFTKANPRTKTKALQKKKKEDNSRTKRSCMHQGKNSPKCFILSDITHIK